MSKLFWLLFERKYTLKVKNCFTCFSLPSRNGSALNGKNLFPLGAVFFMVEKTSFEKGFSVQLSKQEAIVVGLLEQNGGKNYQVYLIPEILKPYKTFVLV